MKIREMEVTDMEQVMSIEQALFSVPWSENGLFQFLTAPGCSISGGGGKGEHFGILRYFNGIG